MKLTMPTPMQHLFSPDGLVVLAAFMQQQPPPLLAFDFDGTLAPIVARPDDARISQAVAARLKALAARLPLAIVTGRAVDDVRGRLGFEPCEIVGNHGAEDRRDPALALALSQALDALRDRLAAQATPLGAAGVLIEDKGQSLALHYRLARNRDAALVAIHAVLEPQLQALRIFGGKMVVNVSPHDAPDKAHAVHALVARLGAPSAFFAGDDLNDEPVFASAASHWLTVRVGRPAVDEPASLARFCVAGPQEMALLLDRMVALTEARQPR